MGHPPPPPGLPELPSWPIPMAFWVGNVGVLLVLAPLAQDPKTGCPDLALVVSPSLCDTHILVGLGISGPVLSLSPQALFELEPALLCQE